MACFRRKMGALVASFAILFGCTKPGAQSAESGSSPTSKKRPTHSDEDIPGFLAETPDGRANIFVPTGVFDAASGTIAIRYAKPETAWVIDNALNQAAATSMTLANGDDVQPKGGSRLRVYAEKADVDACAAVAMILELPDLVAGLGSDKVYVDSADLSQADAGDFVTFTISAKVGASNFAVVCLTDAESGPPGFVRAPAPGDAGQLNVVRSADGIDATATWTASATPGVSYQLAYRPGGIPPDCATWYVQPSDKIGADTSAVVTGLDPELSYGFRLCAMQEGHPFSPGITTMAFDAAALAGLPREFPDPGAANPWIDMTGVTHLLHLNDASMANGDVLEDAAATANIFQISKPNAGNLATSSGLIGGAFLGAGALEYISSTNVPNYSTNQGAITGWFRPNSSQPNWVFFGGARFGDPSIAALEVIFVYGDEFRYTFHSSTSALTAPLGSGGFLDIDTWYMIAITWNGSHRRIYLDGVLQNSANSGATESIYSLRFGSTPDFTLAGETFKGDIDELSVWERALSEEEIALIYENQRPR